MGLRIGGSIGPVSVSSTLHRPTPRQVEQGGQAFAVLLWVVAAVVAVAALLPPVIWAATWWVWRPKRRWEFSLRLRLAWLAGTIVTAIWAGVFWPPAYAYVAYARNLPPTYEADTVAQYRTQLADKGFHHVQVRLAKGKPGKAGIEACAVDGAYADTPEPVDRRKVITVDADCG